MEVNGRRRKYDRLAMLMLGCTMIIALGLVLFFIVTEIMTGGLDSVIGITENFPFSGVM